jgi:hypothetical protein
VEAQLGFSRCTMGDYDLEKMEKEIPLAMMVRHRVREPTLSQVQLNSENFEMEGFSSVPAWLKNSELHPGLPEHYLTSSALDAADLPELPFHVNREILFKMIVVPQSNPNKLPPLIKLMNGTVIINGPELKVANKHDVEIFLHLHEKLLPCCYSQESEVITTSPFTRSRARCYYIPSTTLHEISFLSSSSKVLHRCPFSKKCHPSSVSFKNLRY